MKKTIAGKYIDKVWHPQQESEMDSSEQELLKSCMLVNKCYRETLCDLTDRQKFDMLLNEGPEKTKQALAEIEAKKKDLNKKLEAAKKAHDKVHAKYVASRGK